MAVVTSSSGDNKSMDQSPPSRLIDDSTAVAGYSPSQSPTASPAHQSISSNYPPPSPSRQLDGPAAMKSEEYRQLFRLPQDEVLIQDFNCALQENFLLQGHMYLFIHYICFYSNLFGFETKYMERKQKLQSPTEKSRLLQQIPKVIVDEEELGPVHEEGEEESPKSILMDTSVIRGADLKINKISSDVVVINGKSSAANNVSGLVKVGEKNGEAIILDTAPNDVKENNKAHFEKVKNLEEDLKSSAWHCVGPNGERNGPLSLKLLKDWSKGTPFASKFKAWKENQTEEAAIPLMDAINLAFP